MFVCFAAGCGQTTPAEQKPPAFDANRECERIREFADFEAKTGSLPPGLGEGKPENCKQVMAEIEAKSPSTFKAQSQCLTKAKDYVTAQSCVEQAMMVLAK